MTPADDERRPSATRARRGRGRRPAAEVRGEVLDAAARLLFGEGVAAVTFDRVAAEAGASRTTLYKWWPSAGALAAEAYFARSEPTLEFPDTGDVEADLASQLRAFVRLVTTGGAGPVIAGFLAAAQTDPDLARAWLERYSGPRRALATRALERARDRGQLRADVDPDVVVDQLWGAAYFRLLVPDVPLDEGYADALVANALHGAAA